MTNSQDGMDDLTKLMSTGSSLNDYPGYEKHPRFDDFKNLGKVATCQKQRREEIIERQKNRRNDVYNSQRPMLDDYDDEGDEEIPMESESSVNAFQLTKKAQIQKKYKDQLMLSEWLIDIPIDIHGLWTMVASPKGKRCLVIANEGITTVYSKHGFKIDHFKSGLPGGGFTGHGKTILDCIKYNKNKKVCYYILDVIYAMGMSFCEEAAILRFNHLRALSEEIEINSQRLKQNTRHFYVPPHCACNDEEMSKLMREPLPFDLDGLLFYNNEAWYTPGYTPLVGWLEPWMLPEVLKVPVHESYKKKENNLELKEYVDDYNIKHNHHYVNGKPWENKKPKEKNPEEDEQIIVD